MLRIHFTDADLARTRMAAAPDPLWEIATSLHRLQSRHGRWAYAGWLRVTLSRLHATALERTLLLPRSRAPLISPTSSPRPRPV